MSISVRWDDAEETIIHWDFGASWTWDEFHAAFEQSLNMGAARPYRIDVIPDLSTSRILPPNALVQFNRVARQQPENTILIVITGGSKLDNAMINLFRRAYRVNNWRLAGTIEEARASIYQDRLASSQA